MHVRGRRVTYRGVVCEMWEEGILGGVSDCVIAGLAALGLLGLYESGQGPCRMGESGG